MRPCHRLPRSVTILTPQHPLLNIPPLDRTGGCTALVAMATVHQSNSVQDYGLLGRQWVGKAGPPDNIWVRRPGYWPDPRLKPDEQLPVSFGPGQAVLRVSGGAQIGGRVHYWDIGPCNDLDPQGERGVVPRYPVRNWLSWPQSGSFDQAISCYSDREFPVHAYVKAENR